MRTKNMIFESPMSAMPTESFRFIPPESAPKQHQYSVTNMKQAWLSHAHHPMPITPCQVGEAVGFGHMTGIGAKWIQKHGYTVLGGASVDAGKEEGKQASFNNAPNLY